VKKRVTKKGRLEASLNFPYLQLKLDSADPVNALKEINRLVISLKAIEFNREFVDVDDESILWKFSNISDEFRENKEVMRFVKSASDVEESSRYKKVALENTRVIDFDNNNCSSNLEMKKAKSRIQELCKDCEGSKYAAVHIMGGVGSEQKQAIADSIKGMLRNTEVKTIFTNRDALGKTVIEALFFGSFDQEM